MIKCPKCGADNMIGAIFCRTCGERLNLDDLRPEVELEKQQRPKTAVTIVVRIISLAVFLFLAVLVTMLLLPPKVRVSGNLEQAELQKAQARFKAMVARHRRVVRFTFSSEEATALANQAFGLGEGNSSGSKAAFAPRFVAIQFLSSGYVKCVLKGKVLGFLPVANTVVGRFTSGGGNGVTFEPLYTAVGRLRLPSQLEKLVLRRFDELLARESQVAALASRISKIEVDADEATVYIR